MYRCWEGCMVYSYAYICMYTYTNTHILIQNIHTSIQHDELS